MRVPFFSSVWTWYMILPYHSSVQQVELFFDVGPLQLSAGRNEVAFKHFKWTCVGKVLLHLRLQLKWSWSCQLTESLFWDALFYSLYLAFLLCAIFQILAMIQSALIFLVLQQGWQVCTSGFLFSTHCRPGDLPFLNFIVIWCSTPFT